MTRSAFFLGQLLILIGFYSCDTGVEPAMNHVIITGEILGTETPSGLGFITNYDQGDIAINNNAFLLRIPAPEDIMVDLVYNNHRWNVYAEPGDSIHLEFDHFEWLNFARSMSFSGDKAAENEALLQLNQIYQIGDRNNLPFYLVKPLAFEDKLREMQTAGQKFLQQSIIDQQQFSPTFREWALGYADIALEYHIEQFARRAKNANFNLEAIRSMKDDLKRTDVQISDRITEDPELIPVGLYGQYLTTVLWNDFRETFLQEPVERPDSANIEVIMTLIDQQMDDPEVQEFARFLILRANLITSGLSGIEEEFRQFNEQASNEAYVDALKRIETNWARLQPGAPVQPFALPDIIGNLHRLEDYRGKVLYIDVWATWCGPCLNERPDFEKLVEKYQDNAGIAFIGISIDRDRVAWDQDGDQPKFHRCSAVWRHALHLPGGLSGQNDPAISPHCQGRYVGRL